MNSLVLLGLKFLESDDGNERNAAVKANTLGLGHLFEQLVPRQVDVSIDKLHFDALVGSSCASYDRVNVFTIRLVRQLLFALFICVIACLQ